MPESPPVVSVVTVVRNDSAGLRKTMESVLSQDYQHIEYIVVDGASTDDTVSVLHRRQHDISSWISEPDSGIYEAMNKGARLASGEYVSFLNAGDTFASRDTVSRMFTPPPSAELLWGDCIIEKAKREEYDCARNVIHRLHRQMTVSHQSLFTKRAILLERPYDESLRIAADYDFLCERVLARRHLGIPANTGKQNQRYRCFREGLSHEHRGEAQDCASEISEEARVDPGVLSSPDLVYERENSGSGSPQDRIGARS